MDTPHTVYVLSNAIGEYLYVGITWRWAGRRAQHSRGKWWWPQVTDVMLIDAPDEREARKIEANLIETLIPLYNAKQRTLPLPWTGDGPAPRIVAPRLTNPAYRRHA